MKPFQRSHVSESTFRHAFIEGNDIEVGDWVGIDRPTEVYTPAGLVSGCEHWSEEKEKFVGVCARVIHIGRSAGGFKIARLTLDKPVEGLENIEDHGFLTGHLEFEQSGEVLVPEELDTASFLKKYKDTEIETGDEIRLFAHEHVCLKCSNGSSADKGRDWHEEMDTYVGMRAKVIDVVLRHDFALLRISTGPSAFLWRAGNCKLLKRNSVHDTRDIGTPFPMDGGIADDGHSYFGWVPRRLVLTLAQFSQRYQHVDIKVGDTVKLLPHPMLWLTTGNGGEECFGNFAKSHDEDKMGRWFGEEVKVTYVGRSSYKDYLDHEHGFTYFSCKDVDQFFGITSPAKRRLWRAGDCYVVKAGDGRELVRNGRRKKIEGSVGVTGPLCEKGQPGEAQSRDSIDSLTLAQALYNDAVQRNRKQLDIELRSAAPVPVEVPPKKESLMTSGDARRLADIRQLLKDHSKAIQDADRVEKTLVCIGAPEFVPAFKVAGAVKKHIEEVERVYRELLKDIP